MKGSFVQNLILLVGLNLLVKPLYLLVVETEIQNRVGAENFGNYFALINFSFILNILLDMGITNWNTRKTAQDGIISANDYRKLFNIRLALAALYIIISFSIGLLLNYDASQLYILGILSFNQILVSGILFLRSYLTGMHLFKSDSIISVLDRTLLLAMMASLLWLIPNANSFQIEWLVYGQTISYGITFVVALILISRAKASEKRSTPVISSSNILKESFPFALLIMLSMLGYRADSVMLERMSGSHQAGVYAMGFRFFEAVNMIAYLFAVILLPMFTRQLNQKENISPLLHLSFKILFTGTFIISALCCFYPEEILAIVYDGNILSATSPFAWLMVSSLFFSMQYITGTLITASGRMKPLIYIALGGMIYNIILNIYYIPKEGALGAAKASCFSQMIIFIAQIIAMNQMFDTGKVYKLFSRTIIFSVTSISLGMLLQTDTFVNLNIPYSWTLMLLGMLSAALITGMLEIKRIPELFGNILNKK